MTTPASAVLLLNMGGPDNEEAVEPFLKNLFSDPAILPLPLPGFLRPILAGYIARKRSVKVRPRYRALGGGSPQREITERQAAALERSLNEGGDGPWRVFVAMRYWHPRAEEALSAVSALSPKRFVALSLYPHFSRAVGGSSIGEVEDLCRSRSIPPPTSVVRSFATHPLFIKAHAERIARSLESFPGGGRGAYVLFSAHNLPEKLIREGDPYLDQVRQTVNALLPAVGRRPWKLAFQSRSGPVKWLAPETAEAMREIASKGHRELLLVPLSFVSDQIETLYEIDGQYTEEARRLGIGHFRRTPAFNDDPDFITLLAALARGGAG